MADAGGLQLLPETRKRIQYSTPGQNRLLYISLAFIVLLGLIYGGLYYYKSTVRSKLDDIENKLVKNEEARSKADEEKILELKKTLAVVEPLYNSKISFTQVFNRVQSLVVPQVQFDSLIVNFDKKEYGFKAYGASFAIVAKQVSAFYSDASITDISLGKVISGSDGKIEFYINLKFDPTKIKK